MIKEVPSSNFIEFSDPEIDRLCDETETEFDLEKRIALQRRAHERIAELQPYTWLFTIKRPLVYWKDRVANAEASSAFLFRPFNRWLPMGIRATP
jgi:ABC-type transport system substrate-binding protein